MMPPTLLSLAPELLNSIGENVTKRDLKRLRLTCKPLSDILESKVLDTIHFSVQPENCTEASMRLQYLAAIKHSCHGLSRSSRYLHLGPLSPKDFSRVKAFDIVDGQMVQVFPKPVDGPTMLATEESMRTYLWEALDALKNIQSVTWTPGGKDDAWAHEIVMRFLESRPLLQVLKVELSHLKVAVTLDRMRYLRDISFTKHYRYPPLKSISDQTFNNLAKLLASSPIGQITNLSIVLIDLHQIFQFLTPEVEPLRLTDLRMTGSFVKLDPLTIPHLRHLTCLHLFNMNPPLNNPRPGRNGPNVDIENAEKYNGPKMSDFWLALEGAGVYLKELKVDSISNAFLAYLTRYRGLTKLGVSPRYRKSLPEPDVSAMLFFAKPLANHVETLEELEVEAGFQDLWCFGEHNVSAFSSCTRLESLSVCVPKAERGIVKDLLDMVSTDMPRLSQLSISLAVEGIVHSVPGSKIFGPLIRCLLAYPIPPSTTLAQLPTVVINSRIFEPNFSSLSPDEEEERERRYEEVEEEEDDFMEEQKE